MSEKQKKAINGEKQSEKNGYSYMSKESKTGVNKWCKKWQIGH